MFKFPFALTPRSDRSNDVRSPSKLTDKKPQPVGTVLTVLQQRAVSGGGSPVRRW